VTWAEKAVELRNRALAVQPSNTHFKHQTATARMTLSSAASVAGDHARALTLHAEAADIVQRLLREDPGNKAAERDARLLSFIEARLLVRAGRLPQARALLDQALADLGDPAPGSDDFYLDRIRADTLLWLARAWQPEDPSRAEALARRSAEAMQPTAGDDNAARWWAYALARGEQAQALAARGQTVAASLLARDALQAWKQSMPRPAPASTLPATPATVPPSRAQPTPSTLPQRPAALPGDFRSAYDRDLRLAGLAGPLAAASAAP
jgi:tetratricopeptide (TPR) repeat protein